jgi:hypothetical protein
LTLKHNPKPDRTIIYRFGEEKKNIPWICWLKICKHRHYLLFQDLKDTYKIRIRKIKWRNSSKSTGTWWLSTSREIKTIRASGPVEERQW